MTCKGKKVTCKGKKVLKTFKIDDRSFVYSKNIIQLKVMKKTPKKYFINLFKSYLWKPACVG